MEAMMRAAWAIFFTSCQQIRYPNMFFGQVVMTVDGN
jgi:hypothetical protein